MRRNSYLVPGRLQLISSYNVRVKWLHIDVPDGAAGESPHLGFVFESSSNLKKIGERANIRQATVEEIHRLLTYKHHSTNIKQISMHTSELRRQ